jgi:hypothetical protein
LHPKYDPNTVDNDVALLRIPLEQDMAGTGSANSAEVAHPNVACLPGPNERLPEGKKCSIIGWGKEKNSHVYGTDVLHEAEVQFRNLS